MALPKFTIYKHVKLKHGWRYCKTAFHSNGKIKPNVVLVQGVEETHREGAYYLNHNQTWIPVGEDAKEAVNERLKRLNVAQYHRLNGTAPPEVKKTPVGIPLQIAIDDYLAGIEREVASRNKRKGTLELARNTLKKFREHSKVQYLSEITVAHLDNYAAWCIATSRTHSSDTGRNEFLRVNQFLRSRGIVLTKVDGNKLVPIGMKDAPKVSEAKNVITNTPEELDKFFAACCGFKQWVAFQTLQRTGLREMELVTLRPEDIVLDATKPYIDVCKRTVEGYEFVPKWYQERHVELDPDLTEVIRKLKSTCRSELVFGTASGHLNLHLLRECKRVAGRAGLPPARFRLHRFRANFATHCLREGMDLETLRCILGHRDTESLRSYVNALEGEERAAKMAKVWAGKPLKMAM
ncbi:MAG: site-specific integrase [Terracidiphilus sp.]